jgi:hypothetical protein
VALDWAEGVRMERDVVEEKEEECQATAAAAATVLATVDSARAMAEESPGCWDLAVVYREIGQGVGRALVAEAQAVADIQVDSIPHCVEHNLQHRPGIDALT